jgi:hypothetical protein
MFGAVAVLREVADAQMTSMERADDDASIVRLRTALENLALSSAWAEGRQMTADAAVAFALSG